MTHSAVAEFRVGNVLVRAVSILFRNIVPFGLLSLLLMSPPYIYAMAVDPRIIANQSQGGGGGPLFQLVGYLLGLLLTAALVYGTVSELRGRHAGLGDCIRWGLSLIFPVIGVAILVGLALVLPILVSALVGLAGGQWSFFIFIPGLIVAAMFWTMLWVAVPVAVVERPGVIASLGRSRRLTKGYRWRVFAIIVILYVLLAVVTAVVALVVIAPLSSFRAFANPITLGLVNLVVTAFISALSAVISAVGYHDLRVAKEGIGVEQIAAVFD